MLVAIRFPTRCCGPTSNRLRVTGSEKVAPGRVADEIPEPLWQPQLESWTVRSSRTRAVPPKAI